MGPKDVILNSIGISDFILNSYLEGLTDADLKIRPLEGVNPIALQLGHLISAERMFAEMLSPGSSPALPDGFEAAHSLKEQSGDDSRFLTKDAYLDLLKTHRKVVLEILDKLSDADLDDSRDGKLPPFAPTVGALLNMVAMHSLNHSGQFVAVRRRLKLPVAF